VVNFAGHAGVELPDRAAARVRAAAAGVPGGVGAARSRSRACPRRQGHPGAPPRLVYIRAYLNSQFVYIRNLCLYIVCSAPYIYA
jgi:hypothetical protein